MKRTMKLMALFLLLPLLAVAQIQHIQGPPVNNQSSQPQKPNKQKPPKQNPTVATDYETFTVNGVSFNMVRVEGGTFIMGKNTGYDGDPVHQVTLSTYYIGETELTQGLWEAVMGTTLRQQRAKAKNPEWPIVGEGPNYPMYYISWNDCQEFVVKLRQLTGRQFRLPTEAEWEYAALGGNKSRGYLYSGSNTLDKVAWYSGNSNNNTHPVKTKLANELGIYDMSGNVVEWCQDYWNNYSAESQTNPIVKNGIEPDRVIIRGGDFGDSDRYCTTVVRVSTLTNVREYSEGLRLAL